MRVGSFNLVHGNQFIDFQPDTGDLQVLPRQSAGRFRDLVEGVYKANEGPAAMAIDPTRGQLLGLLIQTPNLMERIQQGGYVGYTIIAMGLTGLIVALWRMAVLQRVRSAKALADPARKPWKQLEFALLVETKRYDEAITLLEEIIALWPDKVRY